MVKVRAYNGKNNYIFVSYSHQDKLVVYPLISELQKYMNVWFDDGINPGSDYKQNIINHINNCSLFLFMVSKNSLESEFCRKEIEFAVKKDKSFINIIIEKDLVLPDWFEFDYGLKQQFFTFQFESPEEAIDVLVNKSHDRFEGCQKDEEVKKEEKPKPEKRKMRDPVASKYLSNEVVPGPGYNEIKANLVRLTIDTLFKNNNLNAECNEFKVSYSYTLFIVKAFANLPKVKKILKDNIISITSGRPYRLIFPKNDGYIINLEIANEMFDTVVTFNDIFDKLPPSRFRPLAIGFGLDIDNNPIYRDLDILPHLLVCGTTGSGKSIFIHSVLATLILRNTPTSLRLVLVDPKKVEMIKYRDNPFLLCPLINDVKEAYFALSKLKEIMEERFNKFESTGSASIKEYNNYALQNNLEEMPYIFVVIDEYADLVDADSSIGGPLVILLQKARAAGIHVLISTQRPSSNIITNVIKGNAPAHVAFMAASSTDSVSIIGESGAEKLAGRGDMLLQIREFYDAKPSLMRLQGCYVDKSAINAAVMYAKDNFELKYDPRFKEMDKCEFSGKEEEQYQEIKKWAMEQEYVSMSAIQRNFSIGFNRAGRFFDRLVKEGILAKESYGGNKGCKVIKRR